MSTQLQKNEYQILDKADEEQIRKAGETVKQALCYEINIGGKKVRQITFVGLKWLALQMSQKGQALEIQSSSVELSKDDPDKQELWFWRANVKCRNQKTGLETEGVAECPYLETKKDGKAYDQFGRTKAHSKAERNAWRKQIPELEITGLLESVTQTDVQDLGKTQTETETKGDVCHCDFKDMKNDGGKCATCGLPLTIGQINALAKRNQ